MQLRVVVGVDVDEPGRDQQTVRVDVLAPGAGVDSAAFGDLPVHNPDVGGSRRRARAVNDRPAGDDEIELGAHSEYIAAALRPKRPARASASIPSVYSRSSSTTPGYLASECGKSEAQVIRSAPINGHSSG